MAENMDNGYSQRNSAEHEGYAKASGSFNRIWKERDSAQPKLLEAILYKRVRANKGKHTPSPVRRVEIPKPDGGVRKLGIPMVIDRTVQQAVAQQLMPIYEPLFIETSYVYRPNKSAKDAILKVKEYAEQKKGQSWKAQMKSDMDETIRESCSYEDFISRMRSKGYTAKGETFGDNALKYLSFSASGKNRFTRVSEKNFGKRYTKEEIRERIEKCVKTQNYSSVELMVNYIQQQQDF